MWSEKRQVWKRRHDDMRLMLYVTVKVCVFVCVLHVRCLCLMRIAGDPEISPICGILWSSLFPVSSRSPCLSADLIVGAFGAGEVSVYRYGSRNRNSLVTCVLPWKFCVTLPRSQISLRASYICLCVCRSRAVVSVEATMTLTPKILNPDDRQCLLPQTNLMVTW